MRKLTVLVLVLGVAACGDFVDEDGNTSFRQVAAGLQSLGDRVGELGEAIERDADVAAVPWSDLLQVLPREVDGERQVDADGDAATDRNGAGLSVAHAKYAVDGDTVFLAVADLGALRSGVSLALRWVAPVSARRKSTATSRRSVSTAIRRSASATRTETASSWRSSPRGASPWPLARTTRSTRT